MRTVIEGCAIATVDAAGTEHRDGHLVIEGDRIVAVGDGPGAARTATRARIDGRGCLATPGPRQLPPPPLPVGHARPRPAGDALRVARRALSGLGARRRRGRVGGGPRRAGRARALGLLDLDRPPLRLPGRRRRPARGRDRGGARRSACASTRAAARWTSGAPTAACRPTRSSRTATRSSPPARRPSTASTTRRPGAMVRVALAPCSPFSVTPELMADDRAARPPPRRAPAHPPGRDARRGGLLPRALRRAPGGVPRGPRLAGRRRVARALRPPRATRRSRASARPAPAWRTARAPTRAWAPASRRSSTSRAPARPSASASTAPRPTRRARWRSSCARRCSSRAWPAARPRMTAREALALATIEGARCLGRDDELGSLEPGKLADVALWRLDGLDHAGIEDPVAALVLGAPRPVDLLLVGGRADRRGRRAAHGRRRRDRAPTSRARAGGCSTAWRRRRDRHPRDPGPRAPRDPAPQRVGDHHHPRRRRPEGQGRVRVRLGHAHGRDAARRHAAQPAPARGHLGHRHRPGAGHPRRPRRAHPRGRARAARSTAWRSPTSRCSPSTTCATRASRSRSSPPTTPRPRAARPTRSSSTTRCSSR